MLAVLRILMSNWSISLKSDEFLYVKRFLDFKILYLIFGIWIGNPMGHKIENKLMRE